MNNRIEFIFDEIYRDPNYQIKDISFIKSVLKNYMLKGKTVLEAGCGTGDNLLYCVQQGVLYAEGFDTSGESITAARAKAAHLSNIFFHKCSLEEYSTERMFDFILALGVFEYFERPLQSLKKICSFLAKDGILVILISKPILIKRVSSFCRAVFSKVPLKFILPLSRVIAKTLKPFSRKFKKTLFSSDTANYTLERTILEGLMVPRYNIFSHKIFCDYLSKEGFSIHFFNETSPSMVCFVARRGITP